MNLRTLHQSDLGDLLALWNRTVKLDAMPPAVMHEKVWEDVNFDVELTLAAEEQGSLIGFIVGVVRETPQGKRACVKLICVDGPHQHQDVGSRLLEELERRFTAREAVEIRVGESAPNYLTPGVDVRNEVVQQFFEAHDYLRFAETQNLETDLNNNDLSTGEDERRLTREGIEIRRAMAGDTPSVIAFLNREQWPSWGDEVRRSFRNAPISLHLARANNEVIGFAAYDSNNIGTGWFGPMGTAASARGKGIGRVLLKRCLRDLKAQGRDRATIPWVGPLEFYVDHVAAAVSRRFIRYQKKLA